MTRTTRRWIAVGCLTLFADGCNCTQGIYAKPGTPPEPPTVETPGTVCSATFTANGTKPASTSILIDDEEVVPFDELTTWQAEVTVDDGAAQTYVIVAASLAGDKSEAVELSVTVNSATPATPTVDAVDGTVFATPLTITGTKEAGVGIWASGVEIVPPDAETTFTGNVELVDGANTILVVAHNGCRESAPVTVSTFYAAPVVTIAIDYPQDNAIVNGTVTLAGTASSHVGFDDVDIDHVEITIDGTLDGTATGAENWTHDWNTAGLGA